MSGWHRGKQIVPTVPRYRVGSSYSPELDGLGFSLNPFKVAQRHIAIVKKAVQATTKLAKKTHALHMALAVKRPLELAKKTHALHMALAVKRPLELAKKTHALHMALATKPIRDIRSGKLFHPFKKKTARGETVIQWTDDNGNALDPSQLQYYQDDNGQPLAPPESYAMTSGSGPTATFANVDPRQDLQPALAMDPAGGGDGDAPAAPAAPAAPGLSKKAMIVLGVGAVLILATRRKGSR